MTRWAKVAKGDRVELKGREYEVTKIKHKGKVAKVTVRSETGATFASEVRLKDKVTRVADPLHDETGAQRRWAKPSEATPGTALGRGNPEVTEAPHPLSAKDWETPQGKTEKALDRILGAHLVGEATDEEAGYYVPPVDVATVAAHLKVFHGRDPSDWDDERDMLRAHEDEHRVMRGEASSIYGPDFDLAPDLVNHWHTETRPAKGLTKLVARH